MNEKQKDLTMQAIRWISQAQGVLDYLVQVELAWMDEEEPKYISRPTPLDLVRDASDRCQDAIELLEDAQV